MIYFTADTHFGHKTICGLAGRPFRCVEEMDSIIINNWNYIVKPEDTVYHLGDFAFLNKTEAQKILDGLNGHKHLVAGNHDPVGRKLTGWESVADLREIRLDGDKVVLCHYPLATWNGAHHGRLHLHGHSHGNYPSCAQRLDVGVDCWLYAPVTFDQIKERAASLPAWAPVDHHAPPK